jgi:signal transduction histidine kinase/ActR/RegA family two-component response regulator/CHASE3 domain sensor protein
MILRGSSIGTRLAVGFAVVIAILTAFAAFTLVLQHRSSEAQREYVQKYVPRAEAAAELERGIFGVAIAWRNWFISGDSEHAAAANAAVEEARRALMAAGRIPKDTDGQELFASLEPAAEHYLSLVTSTLRTGRLSNASAVEDSLSRARAGALNAIGFFYSLQREKAHRSIKAMEASRAQVTQALTFTFVVVALVLMLLGALITQSIRGPARALRRIARDMQAGDWHSALALGPKAAAARGASADPQDELAQIALAFGAAAETLERREIRLRGDARIAGAASRSLEKTTIAEEALAAMAEAVGATVGAVYWREADGTTLRPIAGRALAAEAHTVQLGEGLPGLAAQQGRLTVVRDIPRDSPLRLRTGIDDLAPHSVVAVPALLRNELHGVVVLASLRALEPHELEFLESAALQLAIGLANARAHEHVRRLLDQVRDAQDRLQVQNEELHAQSEELQAQSEELQAQNEEIQAQSEELQRHTTELAQADVRKNEFIGLLAHELRNPLSAIANGVYILGQNPVQREADARMLALIKRQMGYLTRLIDDLLDVSRIAHGKLNVHREVMDLRELVTHCVNDLREGAAQARIALDAEVPPTAVPVFGDRTRLAQVLGNLLGNALKFTEPGGRVAVALRKGGDTVTLAVRDDGAGIEPDVLQRLFQPFIQGRPSHSRPNGGLGLGLALSKALVELHDGHIEARSEGAGQGAELIVTLPLATHRAEHAAPARAGGGVARRILLIEDSEDAAEALQGALRAHGHEVEIVGDGLEAVERARAMRPDLVLCDLSLPGIDGYEVARRLRADPPLAKTPMIALSGYASPEDHQRSRDAGFDDHMAKPVRLDRLLESIASPAGQPARTSDATA